MNSVTVKETVYCSYCGSANKKSAVKCEQCEKVIAGKYRPFYDFLKNHIKDDLKDQLTESVFSYIKNFLLSQSYGVILSVFIVAGGVSVAYGATPYIEKIPEVVVTKPVVEEEPRTIEPFTDDDWQYGVMHISSCYDSFADDVRTSERYWDPGNYYDSADELYAENNIPGYSYSGTHEMLSNPISISGWDDRHDRVVARYADKASLKTGGGFASPLAQTLHNENYTVCEFNYVLRSGSGDYDYETDTGGIIEEELVYRMVLVKYDDNWYLAEDTLLSRYGI